MDIKAIRKGYESAECEKAELFDVMHANFLNLLDEVERLQEKQRDHLAVTKSFAIWAQSYLVFGKWAGHSIYDAVRQEMLCRDNRIAELEKEVQERLDWNKACIESAGIASARIAELEAELEWWHNLVHKHHKNYERSSLREIVQSFIDRIAELEMFVHNCYAEWGCDCQMEEEDGSCRACLAKKLLTQSKPQDKENKK